MKLGLLADLHFRGKDHQVASRVLCQALDNMVRHGVDRVLCAGDVFDEPRILDRHALPGTLLRSFLGPMEKAGIPWLIVEGNHDLAAPGQRGALHALEGHTLVDVVTYPRVIHFIGLAVACLPWCSRAHFMAQHRDPAKQEDAFRAACQALLQHLRIELEANALPSPSVPIPYRVLLGHCEVSGSTNRYRFLLPGSTFCFSNLELEGVGADLIALGHYHMRQGHYLGALRQLNFGEEGNPQGWLLVDTKTGERRWMDVDAPRYHMVSVADYVPGSYHPDDQVKLRGTEAPAKLAPNVTFERQTETRAAVVRDGAGDLDPQGELSQLVGAWLTAANRPEPVEDLVPLLRELAGEVPGGAAGVAGSLTAIESIRLAGLGPHADTRVEFPTDDWSALCGANGSGKTFLLEAPIACWFGNWAHPYRGSLYSTMTGTQATLEVAFRAAGSRWRAHRDLRVSEKGQSQTALLTRLEGPREVPVAGPKVREFECAVEAIVGPRNLILGSIFLSQKAEGDLVAADPAGRREFLRRYLALDRFDLLAELAKGRAHALDSEVVADVARVAILPAHRVTLEKHLAELVYVANRAETLVLQLTQDEEQIERVRAEGERLASIDAQREQLARAAGLARQEAERAAARVADLRRRGEETCRRLEDAPRLHAEVQILEALRAELEELQQVDVARQTALGELRQLELTRDRLRMVRSAARQQLEDSYRQLEREIRRSEDRAKALDDVGCRATPLICPLIDDARQSLARIPELEAQLCEAEMRLRESDYAVEERDQLVDVKTQIENHVVPAGCDPTRLLEVRRQLRHLDQVERQLGQLEQLGEQLTQLETDLVIAQLDQQSADARWAAALEEAGQTEDVRQQLTDLRREYASLKADLEVTRSQLAGIERERGRVEALIEKIQGDILELEQLETALEDRRRRRDGFRLLQLALGKDGVPQLLISAAIPAIQDILADVCETDFGGRFRVRFDTQRATKSNGVRETFDILFSRDGLHEYDARSCSGGEEAAVRAALRIALVLYQAQRAGESYQVAFLDEPAAHQDAENSEATLRMLERLRGRFEQVILVSHDEQQLVGIPYVVHLGQVCAPAPEEVPNV